MKDVTGRDIKEKDLISYTYNDLLKFGHVISIDKNIPQLLISQLDNDKNNIFEDMKNNKVKVKVVGHLICDSIYTKVNDTIIILRRNYVV